MKIQEQKVGDKLLSVENYRHKYHTKYRIVEYEIEEVIFTKTKTKEEISYKARPLKGNQHWQHSVDEDDLEQKRFFLSGDKDKAEKEVEKEQAEEDKKFIENSKERISSINYRVGEKEKEIKEMQQEKTVLEDEIIKAITNRPNLLKKP
jgi:hypothetical protein